MVESVDLFEVPWCEDEVGEDEVDCEVGGGTVWDWRMGRGGAEAEGC